MTVRSAVSRAAWALVGAALVVAGLSGSAAATTTATPQPMAAPGPAAASAAAAQHVPTTGPAGQRYVALGDSYTSSPFTGPPAGPPPGCLRSLNDYPHVVASGAGASLTDVSCSGATTREFANPQTVQGGSNPPQYGALGRNTQLVTVGIGGNDIGFSEIVRSCVSPTPVGSPCKDRYTAGGTDQLRARIAALGPKLATVVNEVKKRSPSAKVLLVGYPSVLPADGPGCYPAVPYTPDDVAYLRGILSTLNDRIAAEARKGGATYVDTATPSLGHDVCQVPGVKWIEGLVPTAPAAPVHPNALGSDALGRAVLATLARD